MTTQEKNEIIKEIESTTAKMRSAIKENSVECGKPKGSKGYTYRKQTIVSGFEAIC